MKQLMKLKAAIVAAVCAVAFAVDALAATWYVDASSGSDSNTGRVSSSAKATIQAAIDVSSAGDTILVGPGTYEAIDTQGKDITIRSMDGAEATTIVGSTSYGLGLSSATAACLIADATNSQIGDSSEDDAWYAYDVADEWRAWTPEDLPGSTLEGFTIEANGIPSARIDGEYYGVVGGRVKNCRFACTDNLKGYAHLSLSVAENCLFVSGALSEECIADCSLRNCTIYTGAYLCSVEMRNTIVYARNAKVYLDVGDVSPTLSNCVFYNVKGVSGRSGVTVADPSFVDAVSGDFRLGADSPCIDGGSGTCGTADLAGNARVVNETIDIGCYEYRDADWDEDFELDASYGPFVPGREVALCISGLDGYRASGLPAGLTFNGSTRMVLGAATTPTGDDGVTVTFTKKGTNPLTTQFVVGPFPAVVVACDGASGCGTVSGTGGYAFGARVSLTATANSGYVFAGWYDPDGNEMSDELGVDYRTATVSFVMADEDVTLHAKFVGKSEDAASLCSDLGGLSLDLSEDWERSLTLSSISVPSVTVLNLPQGMTFDAETRTFSGKPIVPGVYEVKLVLSNASVQNKVETFTVTASNLDSDYIHLLADGESWEKDRVHEIVLGRTFPHEGCCSVSADEGWTLKVTGLPSGLVYDSRSGEISGAATTLGYYAVTFAATKNGATSQVATRTIRVRRGILSLDVLDESQGGVVDGKKSLSGAGEYAVGATARITAVANAGSAFAGWYDENGDDISEELGVDHRLATVSYAMPGRDVTLYAKFVSAADDAASLGSDMNGMSFAITDAWEHRLVVSSISAPTVSVSGLPNGVTFNERTQTFSGKPSELGVYEVTLALSNASVERKIETFTISVPNLDSDLISLSWDADTEYELVVGVPLADELTAKADDGWTLKVTGLPSGVTYNAKTGVITGKAMDGGRFVVTFTATKRGETTQIATRTIYVYWRDLRLGRVSGSGEGYVAIDGLALLRDAYYDVPTAVGKKTSLKAVADTGYVFAGWYQDVYGNEAFYGLGVDYRTPTVSFVMADEDVKLYAKFVSAAEDAGELSAHVDGVNFDVDGEWELDLGHEITSLTLPTVKVSGLPKGLVFDSKALTISGSPTTPGVYEVTLTLSNTSIKNKIEKFTITVPNLDCDVISLSWDADEAYELVAGGTLTDEDELLAEAIEDGWTLKATGLPSGLTYNAKTGLITGKATKPGYYTVTFTATKRGETAQVSTRTIHVYPVVLTLNVIGEEGGGVVAGMKSLSGAGEYAMGAKASLKAVANAGYVFAGWYWDSDGDLPFTDLGVDYRTATVSYVVPESDVELYAKFVSAAEDAEYLSAYLENDGGDVESLDGLTVTVDGTWERVLEVESITVPTVKMTGLPKGLTFDAKNLVISGCPTVPGTYPVTVTLSNTSIKNKTEKFTIIVPNITSDYIFITSNYSDGLIGPDDQIGYVVGVAVSNYDDCWTWSGLKVSAAEGYTLKASGLPAGLKFDAKTGEVTGTATKAGTYTVTFTATKGKSTETSTRTFVVAALPQKVVGTFNGTLQNCDGYGAGTFTLTATDAGKITAKIVNAKGTTSFTGSWRHNPCVPDGGYSFSAHTTKGEEVSVEVNLGASWSEKPMTGCFYNPKSTNTCIEYTISAQKSLFADKWYLAAESDGEGGWTLALVATAAEANLTLTPKGDGTVTLAGKLGTYSVSGSSVLSFNRIADGRLTADFVPFVTVGKTKKALSISCSLDLNRYAGSNAGSAKIVE